MSKCLNFGIICKVSVGSITGGVTEGNVMTIKKVTLPNGDRLPYISGECIRYAIRHKLSEKGEKTSPLVLQKDETGKEVPTTKMNIEEYIDDDLFGFMDAKGARRRTSPIKVPAWRGLFLYAGDRDFGVRRKGRKETGELTANIFETEIYYNYFAGNIMMDVERIGILEDEATGKIEKELEPEKREKRIKQFISVLPELWGGGKQARFLTDISPKFLIYTKQTSKVPIFLEVLIMDEEENLRVEPLLEVLKDYKNIITQVVVGLRTAIFKNEDKIKKKFQEFKELGEKGIQVLSIQEAIEEINKDNFVL